MEITNNVVKYDTVIVYNILATSIAVISVIHFTWKILYFYFDDFPKKNIFGKWKERVISAKYKYAIVNIFRWTPAANACFLCLSSNIVILTQQPSTYDISKHNKDEIISPADSEIAERYCLAVPSNSHKLKVGFRSLRLIETSWLIIFKFSYFFFGSVIKMYTRIPHERYYNKN